MYLYIFHIILECHLGVVSNKGESVEKNHTFQQLCLFFNFMFLPLGRFFNLIQSCVSEVLFHSDIYVSFLFDLFLSCCNLSNDFVDIKFSIKRIIFFKTDPNHILYAEPVVIDPGMLCKYLKTIFFSVSRVLIFYCLLFLSPEIALFSCQSNRHRIY